MSIVANGRPSQQLLSSCCYYVEYLQRFAFEIFMTNFLIHSLHSLIKDFSQLWLVSRLTLGRPSMSVTY